MALFDRKKNNKEKPPAEEQMPAEEQKPTEDQIPIEEQMVRRQSAPRPTPESEMKRMQMMSGKPANANGAMDGFKALQQVIGREQIQAAQQTLHLIFTLGLSSY